MRNLFIIFLVWTFFVCIVLLRNWFNTLMCYLFAILCWHVVEDFLIFRLTSVWLASRNHFTARIFHDQRTVVITLLKHSTESWQAWFHEISLLLMRMGALAGIWGNKNGWARRASLWPHGSLVSERGATMSPLHQRRRDLRSGRCMDVRCSLHWKRWAAVATRVVSS